MEEKGLSLKKFKYVFLHKKFENIIEKAAIVLFRYPYWLWRCLRFPWLPRWWWTGMFGPITPYQATYRWTIPKEMELEMLEEQSWMLEKELNLIKKRVETLKK